MQVTSSSNSQVSVGSALGTADCVVLGARVGIDTGGSGRELVGAKLWGIPEATAGASVTVRSLGSGVKGSGVELGDASDGRSLGKYTFPGNGR